MKKSGRVYRYFLLLLCLSLVMSFLTGCGTKECRTQPYLVLYAFAEEGRMIGEAMSVKCTETHLGRTVMLGEASGKEIVLAELGVGMTNAAMTAQRMIDEFNPRVVIVTGIAGSVDSSVHIGDIVVCREWITHDYGYIGSDGFEPKSIKVTLPQTDSIAHVISFEVDSAMFTRAQVLSQSDLEIENIGDRTPRLLAGGIGVSGNSFIDSKEKRIWLSESFSAVITDMESAAVAQVCAVNDIPFIAFRSASDLAGGSGSETARSELEEFFINAADNSSGVVLRYLRIL